MFNRNSDYESAQAGGTQASYGSQLNASATPPPPGIATRIQDLQTVVGETRDVAYKLRATLGISQPSTESGGTVNAPSSLVDVLVALRDTLNRANRDFQEVITHINS